MARYRFGPSCSCGCGRPARELAGLATVCWMALTPAERRVITETVDLSVVAEAERITRGAV